MAIPNVGRLLRFVGNFDLVHFLRGVELAVHAVDRIARDLHSIDMRLEALCLMRATDVLYSARLVSASGALSSKAQELSDLRCQVARQTLGMSGFREPGVIFAALALVLAVASLRVMTPSLMPPVLVRDTLAGWEVPVAAA